MAERTGIEWTDATVNFWWGCTKVGPGCDHCYAETWSGRFGESLWGVGAPRRKIKGAAAMLNRLDNGYADWAADAECQNGNAAAFGLPAPRIPLARRVFIQSMSDLFDTEAPIEWFAEAWAKIVQCDRLDIQIVTKRISVVEKRLAAIGVTSWPKHAGLLVTVCNQDEADRDIRRLLALKAKLGIPWVGVSAEPLLGPIDFTTLPPAIDRPLLRFDGLTGKHHCGPAVFGDDDMPRLDWIIVGGESGAGARPMHPDWARSIRDQCAAAGTAFFFKQWGEWAACQSNNGEWPTEADGFVRLRADGTTGPDGWPMQRIGKKAAGRLLDGVEHNGMPEVCHG